MSGGQWAHVPGSRPTALERERVKPEGSEEKDP